jgi:hypothetical protein
VGLRSVAIRTNFRVLLWRNAASILRVLPLFVVTIFKLPLHAHIHKHAHTYTYALVRTHTNRDPFAAFRAYQQAAPLQGGGGMAMDGGGHHLQAFRRTVMPKLRKGACVSARLRVMC